MRRNPISAFERKGEGNRSPESVQRFPDCFPENSPQENMNQVAFVFGAAFVVVEQIGGVGNRVGGFRQALLNVRARAGQ